MRPTSAESEAIGSPVTVRSTTSGVAIDPNATGDVFASRQIPAA